MVAVVFVWHEGLVTDIAAEAHNVPYMRLHSSHLTLETRVYRYSQRLVIICRRHFIPADWQHTLRDNEQVIGCPFPVHFDVVVAHSFPSFPELMLYQELAMMMQHRVQSNAMHIWQCYAYMGFDTPFKRACIRHMQYAQAAAKESWLSILPNIALMLTFLDFKRKRNSIVVLYTLLNIASLSVPSSGS